MSHLSRHHTMLALVTAALCLLVGVSRAEEGVAVRLSGGGDLGAGWVEAWQQGRGWARVCGSGGDKVMVTISI